jgi:phosphate transport system substrate-binding protein
MKLIPKILLSILATVALLLGGLFVLLFVALGGGLVFHQAIVVATFIVLWLFLLLQIWKLFKSKIRYISVAVAVGVMVISVTGYEINRAYHNSVERVDEQGVDLSLYDPFREGTLTVSLNEPSILLLTDNLPRLDGATALYPVYSAFAKTVYPADTGTTDVTHRAPGDIEIAKGVNPGDDSLLIPEKPGFGEVVACTNTDGAYRRLISGEADIIFVAGPSEGQLQMAREAGLELSLTPIGREAFVFFVNAQNPVSGLSINDIQRIYSGEVNNWREFGGKNSRIRSFQRPENSGSQTALIQFMGDVPLMTPPTEDVASGMGGIINRVSSYRNYDNAIGYSFLFFATEMVNDDKIKLLELNGVAPTRENVANRTYPYASEFYAVTTRSENPNIEIFIEWILSEQGQYLIDTTGYTPLH